MTADPPLDDAPRTESIHSHESEGPETLLSHWPLDSPTETGFLRQLHEGISRLVATNKSVLIAVSGGADSVALLCGCCRLAASLRLRIRAAHFNHRLRGEESDADADFVRSLCEDLEVPLTIAHRGSVHSLEASGIEETARDERYEFLKSVASENRCRHIATAHTADDQVETVLHHILRGTGLAGLRGIPASRDLPMMDDSTDLSSLPLAARREPWELAIIRPMLSIRRSEVEAFLAGIGQDFRTDSTNRDTRFTRNRIRHELIPLLEREFHPAVVNSLLRLSRQAAEVEEAIRELAEDIAERCVLSQDFSGPDEAFVLDGWKLIPLPRHLRREVFVRLWDIHHWPRGAMTFAHWDRLAGMVDALADASLPGTITLAGGIECRRKMKTRRLTIRRRMRDDEEPADDLPLSPGIDPGSSDTTTDLAGSCDDPLQGVP